MTVDEKTMGMPLEDPVGRDIEWMKVPFVKQEPESLAITGSPTLDDKNDAVIQILLRAQGRTNLFKLLVGSATSDKRDDREAALYVLDLLIPTERETVFQVLDHLIKTASSENLNGLSTVGLFVVGSQFAKHKNFERDYKVRAQTYREKLKDLKAEGSPQDLREPNIGILNATQLIVIIHGTWADAFDWIRWPDYTSRWYEWPESFPDYLDKVSGGAVYKKITAGSPPPFKWTGANDHDDRILAANDLKVWIEQVMAPDDKRKLTIVAHSHGGNVALMTAARHDLYINKLILLGTPIRTEYPVRLNNIGSIWNIYSTGDYIQGLGGMPNSRGEAKTLSDSQKIWNIMLENKPGHSALHDSAVWQSHHLEDLVK